jgi:hypothetical protein
MVIVEGRNIKLIIAFKTALMQATILELVGDISITDMDL